MAKADLDLDVEAVQPEQKSGGALKWIIIGVVGLLLLGGATYAALYFAGVVGGDATEAIAEGETGDANAANAAKAAPKAPLIYLPMEPFVVNFDMKADVRFMQVTLQVATRDAAVIERVKEHTPAIRNGLVMLYSSQDPIVLNTRAGKETLLQQSLDEINKVLKGQSGTAGVENVYFTSFVMQ